MATWRRSESHNLWTKGHLIEKVSDNEWHVQMGIMKMKVKEADLQFIKSPQKEKQTKPLTTIRGKDFHVSLELDLRGERYENALARVEKYIDDALLSRLSTSVDHSW